MKKIIKKEYTRYENSDRTIFVELWNSDKAIKGIIYDSHYVSKKQVEEFLENIQAEPIYRPMKIKWRRNESKAPETTLPLKERKNEI